MKILKKVISFLCLTTMMGATDVNSRVIPVVAGAATTVIGLFNLCYGFYLKSGSFGGTKDDYVLQWLQGILFIGEGVALTVAGTAMVVDNVINNEKN